MNEKEKAVLYELEDLYFEMFPKSPLYIRGLPVLTDKQMIAQIKKCLKEGKPIEEYFKREKNDDRIY